MTKVSSGYLLSLLLLVVLASFWSFIDCYDYFLWWLEALPVLIVLVILLASYRAFPLTPLSYGLIAMHALILLVGAHYSYAEVPLFNWLRDTYDFSRNHYDKVGHFAQGAIPAIVIRELLLRTSPLKPGKWLFTIILFSCLGISAVYELLEWAVAISGNESAEDFLGTQGDVWDTQKDMFACGVGAACFLLLLSRWHDRQLGLLGYSPAASE